PNPKEQASLDEMIKNAGAGVQLAPVEVRLGGETYTIQAPAGAAVDAFGYDVTIRHGEKFHLRILPGKVDFPLQKERWQKQPEFRSITAQTEDLVLRELARRRFDGEESIFYCFALNVTLGYLDFHIEEGSFIDPGLDDCLLLLKCAKTFALKKPAQPLDSL